MKILINYKFLYNLYLVTKIKKDKLERYTIFIITVADGIYMTIMDRMFYQCKKFNKNLIKWDINKVKSLKEMFFSCFKFNKSLNLWDVTNKQNNDMFKKCVLKIEYYPKNY